MKQHAGHLYDLEELWWKRLDDFNQNKSVLTAADISNVKTHNAAHNEKRLNQLLHLFATERRKMLEVIFSFDEQMLCKTSVHPRLKTTFRLINYLYFIAEHDDYHIAQISLLLQDPPIQII